jgi:putative hydrolase of the HAD superfamily
MAIRHVLFDADGVLQDVPGGWEAAMEPFLGERTAEFLDRTWSDELPMLAGRGDYLPLLTETLREFGVTEPVEAVYAAVWHNIEVIEESLTLVRRLRAGGYGVHLATNQEQYRGGYMRSELGYDDLFDVSCYSYDLGVAKPDPGFFVEAARRVGAPPAEIVFVDDSEPNVASAASVGMAAVHWSFDRGHDVLRDALRDHGVHPGGSGLE